MHTVSTKGIHQGYPSQLAYESTHMRYGFIKEAQYRLPSSKHVHPQNFHRHVHSCIVHAIREWHAGFADSIVGIMKTHFPMTQLKVIETCEFPSARQSFLSACCLHGAGQIGALVAVNDQMLVGRSLPGYFSEALQQYKSHPCDPP
jgi:hypothetical protein